MSRKFESTMKSENKPKNFKKHGKSKGKTKNNDKTFNDKVSNEKLTSLNDISWYSRNPELLAAAARFPFPYKPGMRITMPQVRTKAGTYFDEYITIPGVFRIDFVPTIGYSNDVNSPVSIAAKELYGRVRSKFSGSLDADAPDMMMFNIALDSIHMYIAYLKRLYRALSTYSPYNRDYPVTITTAITDNYGSGTTTQENLRRDRVLLWSHINELIHMANKFVLPKDMDFYDRHRWMCEHIYLDSPEPNAQSYLFRPTGFWRIDETESTGTALMYVPLSTTAADANSAEYYFNFGKDLIGALSNWEDAYTISGYYSRAFDGNALYTADLLMQDEQLIPVYQPEVLTQIENAKSVSFSVPKITQDPNTNAVIFRPLASEGTAQSKDFTFMNLHSNLPDGAAITIASRLMSFVKDGYVYCGTEAVLGFKIFLGPNGTDEYTYNSEYTITATPSEATLDSIMYDVAKLSWFGRHPVLIMYVSINSTPTSSNTMWAPLGEIENFSIISKENLIELHKVCVYSEFNCFR